ncbi:hypothetical protein AAHE18_09G160500 [Arachis hypogaea]|uniref:DUF7733 domain-containing protein n=1 Tax=Arachis hypogaea TaxID=3818 RepID=A0A445BG35_ARAHY|nr:hypothetical protein Ahy_A09g042502 isoform E [Arachis hypogaea]
MSGGVGPTSDISLPKEEEVVHKEQQDHSLKNSKNASKSITTTRRVGFLSFRQLNCLAVGIVLSASGMEAQVFSPQNKVLKLYVLVGAIIGLYAPIAYILEGIFEGDKEGIKAAAPHVFLLASQVFMEGVAFSGRFSTPIRAFVPVFYNSRRIFSIVDWLRSEIYKINEEHSGSDRRVYVGRALAVANMAFWCFNLFGFLLPVYLPRVFKLYYSAPKDN